MWRNRGASIKDDPVNPALVKSRKNRGCVRRKPLASIVTSLGRNEGWTCPHHVDTIGASKV